MSERKNAARFMPLIDKMTDILIASTLINMIFDTIFEDYHEAISKAGNTLHELMYNDEMDVVQALRSIRHSLKQAVGPMSDILAQAMDDSEVGVESTLILINNSVDIRTAIGEVDDLIVEFAFGDCRSITDPS